LRVGALNRARLRTNRTRYPVDRPELVDDRALDARDRVGLELVTATRVELVDRIDEPEDAVAHEIRLFDVLRKASGNTTGNKLHERRVVKDQPLARVERFAVLVLAPEFGDVRGGVVHDCCPTP